MELLENKMQVILSYHNIFNHPRWRGGLNPGTFKKVASFRKKITLFG
jgi:hypothetical protein